MLPSQSVLNLILTSSSFWSLGANLSNRFWKSRPSWDAPWAVCTGLQGQLSQERRPLQYRVLVEQPKMGSSLEETETTPAAEAEASAYEELKDTHEEDKAASPPEEEAEALNISSQFLGLKNRRRIRIWQNCEMILRIIEDKFSDIRKQSGSVSPAIKQISNYWIAPVTQGGPMKGENIADVYFVPSLVKSFFLNQIIAYFGPMELLVGIEFVLQGEESRRLFGTRSDSRQLLEGLAAHDIKGFVISLGDELCTGRNMERFAVGLGILTRDNTDKIRYTLGKWREGSVKQVLRLGRQNENRWDNRPI